MFYHKSYTNKIDDESSAMWSSKLFEIQIDKAWIQVDSSVSAAWKQPLTTHCLTMLKVYVMNMLIEISMECGLRSQ